MENLFTALAEIEAAWVAVATILGVFATAWRWKIKVDIATSENRKMVQNIDDHVKSLLQQHSRDNKEALEFIRRDIEKVGAQMDRLRDSLEAISQRISHIEGYEQARSE